MTMPTIVTEQAPHDAYARTFHISKPISAARARKLTESFQTIEGVAEVAVADDSVHTTILPTFSWQDITPHVVYHLTKGLGWQEVEIHQDGRAWVVTRHRPRKLRVAVLNRTRRLLYG